MTRNPTLTPCPACEASAERFWSEGAWWAARCSGCGHVFSRGGDAPAVYEADYFERWYLAHRESRIDYFQALVADHALDPRGPLLDVGAGVGLWLEVCRGLGIEEATAVEPSEFGRERLAELRAGKLPGLEIHADLGALAGRKAYYTTITLLDVLSHVDDLRGTLGTARRLLRDDGHLILKAPNHAAGLFRAARWLAPLGRGRSLLCVRSQQHHFSRHTLPGLLGRFGFRTLGLVGIHEAAPDLHRDPRSWVLNRLTRLSVGPESLLWIGAPAT